MPRSYRSLILAIAGLALAAGSPPKQAEQSKQGKSASKAEQSLPPADPHKPVEKDRGCEKGADQRDSDLCAQWKAADAAKDAADYAWWTVLLSAASAMLLIWTLWETRRTSRRELRAYLHVTQYTVDVTTRPHHPWVKIKIENCGQTPAFKVRIDMRVFFVDLRSQLKIESRDFTNSPPGVSLGPGANLNMDRAWMGEDRSLLIDYNDALCAFAEIRYFDAFGCEHFTRFCITGFGLVPDYLDVRLYSEYNDSD